MVMLGKASVNNARQVLPRLDTLVVVWVWLWLG